MYLWPALHTRDRLRRSSWLEDPNGPARRTYMKIDGLHPKGIGRSIALVIGDGNNPVVSIVICHRPDPLFVRCTVSNIETTKLSEQKRAADL